MLDSSHRPSVLFVLLGAGSLFEPTLPRSVRRLAIIRLCGAPTDSPIIAAGFWRFPNTSIQTYCIFGLNLFSTGCVKKRSMSVAVPARVALHAGEIWYAFLFGVSQGFERGVDLALGSSADLVGEMEE